jgi:hypothetical protein
MPPAVDLSLTVDDWRRALEDPAYFASRILGIELHPGQKRWIRRSTARENILVTGNRWGKSFVSAIKLLHHALFRLRPRQYDRSGRYRAISASITQDQANLIFNALVRIMRQSAWMEPLIHSIRQTPHPQLKLTNGAVIQARSTQNRGEYLLGNDYDLFIFDEVAFEPEPDYVVEEIIMMRLADRDGRLDLVSTPNGKNWFYTRAAEILEKRRSGYYQSGDSRENSHISRDFLNERVTYFSEARLKQNIMGQFVDAGDEILKGAYVDAALERARSRTHKSGEGVSYITGWDLARKRTATVGITIAVENRTAHVVALTRMHDFDWRVVMQKICDQKLEFPGRLVIDATGLGDVIVQQLDQFNPQAVIFTPQRKSELLTNVELFHARDAISYDRWELPDGPGRVWSLEDELRSARWDDNNECDALMALALALWPLARKDSPIVAPRVGKL